MFHFTKWLAVSAAAVFLLAPSAHAKENAQEWELVTPTGVVKLAQLDPAKRITSLDGKTVALRWNGKNNGNVFLDRVAENFAKRFPNTKVVKTYEDATLNTISGTNDQSLRIAKAVAACKPDLVIAAQAD